MKAPERDFYAIGQVSLLGGVRRPIYATRFVAIEALAIEARFPYAGTADLWNYSDNLTRIAGPHNIKLGIFIENASRNGNRTGGGLGLPDGPAERYR